jgi:hypothetical protein
VIAARRASRPTRWSVSYGITGSYGSASPDQKWRNPDTGKQVIVACHRGRILPLGTMKAIIEGSGAALQAWLK